MAPTRKNPTLDDVAAQAGVSSATVSRFVNNPEVVAPATAERIRAAIAATGYLPNLLASGMASSKSKAGSTYCSKSCNSPTTHTR